MTPVLVPGLKDIVQLAAGANHILALDKSGNVSAWGSGEQSQLGRRIVERMKYSSLVPSPMGLPKKQIVKVAAGSYHSFAIDKKGAVWSWGLNNFGETGHRAGAGDADASILKPAVIKSLREYAVKEIAGGEHHSVALCEDGRVLTWGRVDGSQVGVEMAVLNEDNAIYDDNDKPRILMVPTANTRTCLIIRPFPIFIQACLFANHE